MAAQYDVFLETQRGAWESQLAYQRQNPDSKHYQESANAFNLVKVYGAGWLAEAGQAFGRNASFLPNGSNFKRIMEAPPTGEAFGVEDLYAAFLLLRAGDKYKFGRAAEKSTRRQTRFLFYMVAIDLLKEVLIRNGKLPTNKMVSRALVSAAKDGDASQALFDAAVEAIDEYLTPGEENSVFQEPSLKNAFNSDVHGFLRWERLGKSDETTPILRRLIADHRRTLGRAWGAADRRGK